MQFKLEQLQSLLCSYESVVVAYSGGVDSAFLAKVAHDTLGARALAVIADSPSLPRRELAEAMEIGRQFGFPVEVIKTEEMNDPNYTSNPFDRCYYCKQDLFEHLVPLAQARGFKVIVYGENASDKGDYRPGAQAAKEFRVRAPLKEAGLTKADIRELSSMLGLSTTDKPQMACLSSRIPYGEPVTEEALRMIEAAENVLRDAGFYDVRVRHHTMGNPKSEIRNPNFGAEHSQPTPQNPKQYLARIEVGQDELPRLLDGETRERISEELTRIGYAHVTVDLQGYRRGSLNAALPAQAKVGKT